VEIEHLNRIHAVAAGQKTPADDTVSASWIRSATKYRVDPASDVQARILTLDELKRYRETVEQLIVHAQEELDRLYGIVREACYVVLLCDRNGIAVDHRGNEARAADFAHWVTWVGGIWSEEAEGTTGIGTCIYEQRPVTFHQTQHFRSGHIGLSCSAAPIFDSDGEMTAVLDVSSIDPNLSEHSHALTGALVIASARAIEERLIRERFRRQWILAVAVPARIGSTVLLAVDEHQDIVGADRNARTALLEDSGERGLWAIFERNHGIFRGKDPADVSARLSHSAAPRL
jgi:transcriptional regulator of acetoin/glycerol metabolism